MTQDSRDVGTALLDRAPFFTRDQVLARPNPVPEAGGAYGWWFRRVPDGIGIAACRTRDGLTLLYVGISPKGSPAKGEVPSRATLRTRLNTHFTGNAEGSTLRRTLGCLLADELGIELRRVGSGKRFTFVEGEQRLSAWMSENALVSWVPCDRPWDVEHELIHQVDLPLNLDDNGHHAFHPSLTAIRAAALRRARELPVVENPGIGGRRVTTLVAAEPYQAKVAGDDSAPEARVGRLVLDGRAASTDRRSLESSRSMLMAALKALRAGGIHLGILITPAGFVDDKLDGPWHAPTGWSTTQDAFATLAARATEVARSLANTDIVAAAAGVANHLIVGIDVWPTARREPHAETAILVNLATGAARPLTGKTYPTTGQQDDLIRNPDPATHVAEIGTERVAVLVCHDLAAWSPRGNAVAQGARAGAWRAMQTAVSASRPTLAVQLPHTVDKTGTWHAAWLRFASLAGPDFAVGTTAIRHLDQGYRPVDRPVDAALLAGTGVGRRVVDIVVQGRVTDPTAGPEQPVRPVAAPKPRATSNARAQTGSAGRVGMELAHASLGVFVDRAGAYPHGITIAELIGELQRAGVAIGGNDPSSTLRTALNGSQAYGLWLRLDGGLWVEGAGQSKMDSGLSGRALAEALHAYVRDRYPSHEFHYEVARVGLERTGVEVKGTGRTTRAAMLAAPDLFEHVETRRGYWRWR